MKENWGGLMVAFGAGACLAVSVIDHNISIFIIGIVIFIGRMLDIYWEINEAEKPKKIQIEMEIKDGMPYPVKP